jgi:hypothetical protein
LALRIGAISNEPGCLFDGADEFLLTLAVDEGGEFKHGGRVSFVGKETIARDG